MEIQTGKTNEWDAGEFLPVRIDRTRLDVVMVWLCTRKLHKHICNMSDTLLAFQMLDGKIFHKYLGNIHAPKEDAWFREEEKSISCLSYILCKGPGQCAHSFSWRAALWLCCDTISRCMAVMSCDVWCVWYHHVWCQWLQSSVRSGVSRWLQVYSCTLVLLSGNPGIK